MVALSVNVNKIALIRNSRPGNYPDLVAHARRICAAGADGITVHPRPDQRHVRASDPALLKAAIDVELNIEGNPFAGPAASARSDVGEYPGFMDLVLDVRPAQCTLVPDSDAQLTSDHGFDLRRDADRLAPLVDRLRKAGIRVSLFMDPLPEQIRLAAQVGADRIELYTGPYAAAVADGHDVATLLKPYRTAAEAALDCGLGVNAGHDLNLQNLEAFRAIPGLLEVSIGHAFTVDCLDRGIDATVDAYQACLGKRT
jgi:pyridoxine 5-phosphate synthase